MNNINDQWKISKEIFYDQINLNLKELSSEAHYPQHWKDFLVLLNNISISNILDIGCGCGAYYALIQQKFNHIKYTGIDYSDEAIKIAKDQWKYSDFLVKNIWDLDKTFISKYDAIHASALFDVMSNGDEALDFLLGLCPKIFIISRMAFTDQSSYNETYLAYDKFETCRYYHNINNFINLCDQHKYKIYKFNTNLLLVYDN